MKKRSIIIGLLFLFSAGAVGADSDVAREKASKPASEETAAVKLEMAQPLRQKERLELSRAGFDIAEYLGGNKYLALVPSAYAKLRNGIDIPYVRAITPISPGDKISSELSSGRPPEHAILPDGRVKVRVEVFGSKVLDADKILSRYGKNVHQDPQSNGWLAEVEPDQLRSLAAEAAIKRVEAVQDPMLLELE